MKYKDYNERVNDLVVNLHVGKSWDVLTRYLIFLGLNFICALSITMIAVEPLAESLWQLVGFSFIIMTVISVAVRLTYRFFDNIFYGEHVGLFLYALVVAFTINSSSVLLSNMNLIIVSAFAGLYIFSREMVYTIINYKS